MPAVFCSIIVHAIVIIVAAHYGPLREFLAAILDVRKNAVVPFRSTGLVAGYDIAGLFCLVGLSAALTRVIKIRSRFVELLAASTLFVGCYYTSRASMVIAGALFLALLVRQTFGPKNSSGLSRLIPLLFGGTVFSLVGYQVLLILSVAFKLRYFITDKAAIAIVSKSFAGDTLGQRGLPSMYFLPNNIWNVIFGEGTDVPTSDVGYIKEIFWGGAIGLIILFMLHVTMLKSSLAAAKQSENALGNQMFLVLVFGLVFVLSFKNDYLLTRGVWALLIITYLFFRNLAEVPRNAIV